MCSDRAGRRRRWSRWSIGWGAGLALWAAPTAARVLLTVDEALALAFPEAKIEHQTRYLTDEQQGRIVQLAGESLATAIVHPYVARRGETVIGTAYFDVHVVRTLPETLMVVLDPAGRVARIEVLSFDEPPDYLPRGEWYAQFRGRGLDPELSLAGAIRPVTGATLTARVTTAAVRRVLALDLVLTGRDAP